ncbi:MAG: polymer-forming cytoskeletal protein [Planctomycetota bacterium]
MSIFGGPAPKTTSTTTTDSNNSASRVAPTPLKRSEAADTPGTISSIGAGMTIIGQVVSEGVVNVFGRIEGELRASVAFIGDAAHFEGNIVAQELSIRGHIKGTIYATRVKLESSAVVQGDIFHRSLSIEENAQFEGSSRRQENPTDASSNVQEKAPNLQPQMGPADAKRALDDAANDEVASASAL